MSSVIGGFRSGAAMAKKEESKKPSAKKKEAGFLGKMGDKISAGLFKASKMNKNAFSK